MGSGRKPKARAGIVLGMDGARLDKASALPPAVSAEDRDALLIGPDDLSKAARMCWARYAEHAIAERTLIPATVPGFRQFCQQWAYVVELDARIEVLGAATHDADPYLKSYVRMSQRLDASMARFKLTAFGKPATSEKPKAAANPWAQVVAK